MLNMIGGIRGTAAGLPGFRRYFMSIFAVSAVLNVLMLSGSFYMLMVYDNVLASRSLPTLWGLLAMVTLAYAFQGLLDLLRGRAIIQISSIVDQKLAARVFDIMAGFSREGGPMRGGEGPLRDLDQVRGYLSGPGPLAILDMPWVLLYLAILFAFHWALGVTTLIGLFVLIGLTILADRMTYEETKNVNTMATARAEIAEVTRRNSEVIRALGMTEPLRTMWHGASTRYLSANERLADVSSRLYGLSRTFRMLLQSLMLTVGAVLVIEGSATGGIIIAGSILSARALAPIEQAIASWKQFAGMQQSAKRLAANLAVVPPRIDPMELPAPSKTLLLEDIYAGPPASGRMTLSGINFKLAAGDVLVIVGRSGCGKSTLVRVLAGIWPALRGTVRLDGAGLEQWAPDALGRHIGYVPQSIELFPGTIAENIGRCNPAATPEQVIAAAKIADVHDMIIKMPKGYDTRLGPGGVDLSAGQKQRLALARALFGDPFLLLFDEPNSNLDQEGESALIRAIENARDRGAIVVVVAHRASILSVAKYMLVIADGKIEFGGKRDDVLKRLNAARPQVSDDRPKDVIAEISEQTETGEQKADEENV